MTTYRLQLMTGGRRNNEDRRTSLTCPERRVSVSEVEIISLSVPPPAELTLLRRLCLSVGLYVCHMPQSSNNNISCRREVARCFMSFNILLNHLRSLKVIRNDTLSIGPVKSLLVFHCNYVCISYRF